MTVVDYHAEDEATRERIRAETGRTFLVEAGAGTGKTRALVERVVAHVIDGVSIDRIIAITFTERAAAELRERVRQGLESCARDQPEHAERAVAALGSLDRAQISTIHAFALAQLYAYAAEAGVDPGFRVQDEVVAARRLSEQWRLFLERLADDAGALRGVDRVLSLGLGTVEIERLAMDLVKRGELLALLEAMPLTASAPAWPDVHRMYAELSVLPIDTAVPGDKLREKAESLLALLKGILRAPTGEREAVLASGSWLLGDKFSGGIISNWRDKRTLQDVKDEALVIAGELCELLAGVRSEALAGLMPHIVRFARQDAVARGREGLMTFDDLILLVRDLLLTHPGAAASLRARYNVLLIDEFQDTDPLQVDIAMSFARRPENGMLEDGRLFLVGDPKQSIYRFRKADMAIYSETARVVREHGGQATVLALNQRSTPVVVDWVNAVFAGIIGTGDEPHVQPQYLPVHAARDASLPGPGVAVYGWHHEDKIARDVRYLDARMTAGLCRAAVEWGWQVSDRRAGTTRPCTYRDIAVLMPARVMLAPLERALADASIPFRVEGGSLVYRTQEVRDLINCLTAVDDPADEVAIVAALRSPAFACSDVDLAMFRADNGRLNYLSSDLGPRQGIVADALRLLKGFHESRHDTSLAALTQKFVLETGLVETGLLDAGDRNSFRRMRFMVEQARTFEAAGPESLRAFVTWLETRAETALLDHEGAALDDDEDAVRVSTIHGAKGLEFPIVFVCGLGSAHNSRTPTYQADLTAGRVGVRIGYKTRGTVFDLGPVEALQHLEEEHAKAEYARMLYVAATRARDHLVVSLNSSKAARSNCGARLLEAAGAEPFAQRLEAPALERAPVAPALDRLAVDWDENGGPEFFDERRDALVKASRRQRYTSATAIRDSKNETDDDTEPWSRGRGGTRLGRAVHATIQSLSLSASDSDIAAFAKAQSVAEAIPHRQSEVEDLVRRALASDAANRARAARRALREVPFAVTFGSTIVEGFLDMIIESDAGIEIVDWKTDQIPAVDVPDRLQKYEMQAGLYVLGVEAATGRSVSRVTYVFVSAGVEQSPGDPSGLADRARAQIAGQPPDTQLAMLGEA